MHLFKTPVALAIFLIAATSFVSAVPAAIDDSVDSSKITYNPDGSVDITVTPGDDGGTTITSPAPVPGGPKPKLPGGPKPPHPPHHRPPHHRPPHHRPPHHRPPHPHLYRPSMGKGGRVSRNLPIVDSDSSISKREVADLKVDVDDELDASKDLEDENGMDVVDDEDDEAASKWYGGMGMFGRRRRFGRRFRRRFGRRFRRRFGRRFGRFGGMF